MEYLSAIITVAVLHFLAVMSPGPDFIMVSRNALLYSRKSGVYSALGLALGILLHVSYSLIGIGLIISKSIVLFFALKLIGSGYLLYIGYKMLHSKKSELVIEGKQEKKDISKLSAIKMGFMTNATNPKATLFFLSIFTLVINPATPLFVKLLMGIEMTVATFLWFAFVATILSHGIIKKQFIKIQHHIERVMGVVLVLLGIKLALSTSK